MSATRDTQLRLGTRQASWLRRERLHRQFFVQAVVYRWFLRALTRDAGLRAGSRALAQQRRHRLTRLGATGRHRSRCYYSGRARQVSRTFQAARMHLRQLAREGQLAQVLHQRT